MDENAPKQLMMQLNPDRVEPQAANLVFLIIPKRASCNSSPDARCSRKGCILLRFLIVEGALSNIPIGAAFKFVVIGLGQVDDERKE
jgi:hypothetical protein